MRTVVATNGPNVRTSVKAVWRNSSLPSLVFTTRDIGVDVQWEYWRNPVHQSRVGASLRRTAELHLAIHGGLV